MGDAGGSSSNGHGFGHANGYANGHGYESGEDRKRQSWRYILQGEEGSSDEDLDTKDWEEIIWDKDTFKDKDKYETTFWPQTGGMEQGQGVLQKITVPFDIPLPSISTLTDAEEDLARERRQLKLLEKKFMYGNPSSEKDKDKGQSPSSASATATVVKDPYNYSNDEYYTFIKNEKTLRRYGQPSRAFTFTFRNECEIDMRKYHAISALELQAPLFPTNLSGEALTDLHRPFWGGATLYKEPKEPLKEPVPQSIYTLTNFIVKKAKEREAMRRRLADEEWHWMPRNLDDLSGKDGDLILIEYSEQFPPLLSQVGMASRILTYVQGSFPGCEGLQHCPAILPTDYSGDIVRYGGNDESPFLGRLEPGEWIQGIENNMYRAPLYRHASKATDFLLLRDRNGDLFIREINAVFTAGQECPFLPVPAPGSRALNKLQKDMLHAFICRLLAKSCHRPRRISVEEVKDAFPSFGDAFVRTGMKNCARFTPEGTALDTARWFIKPGFALPSEDELRSLVTPEILCLYYSLQNGQQRLKNAGYLESSFQEILTPKNEGEPKKKENRSEDNEEFLSAPWNTTFAFTEAMKGANLLTIIGKGDPTGRGEGFAYVRIPSKRGPASATSAAKRDNEKFKEPPKKKGRKSKADNGMDEETSSSSAKSPSTPTSPSPSPADGKKRKQNSNANRFKIQMGIGKEEMLELQDNFEANCQDVFCLQNKVLENCEEQSSEEDDDESEEEEKEEIMAKNIEDLLNGKKGKGKSVGPSLRDLEFRREEEERKELLRMMLGDDYKEEEEDKPKPKNGVKKPAGIETYKNPVLKIRRKIENPPGSGTFTECEEEIRDPKIIRAYTMIRSQKEEVIKKFALTREDMKKIKTLKVKGSNSNSGNKGLSKLMQAEGLLDPPRKKKRKSSSSNSNGQEQKQKKKKRLSE